MLLLNGLLGVKVSPLFFKDTLIHYLKIISLLAFYLK